MSSEATALPTKRRTSSRTVPMTAAGVAPFGTNFSASSSWWAPYKAWRSFIASVTPSLRTHSESPGASSR